MKKINNKTLRPPLARPTEVQFQELSTTLMAEEFRLLRELEGLEGPEGINPDRISVYVRQIMGEDFPHFSCFCRICSW